jgi:hypothetical protein
MKIVLLVVAFAILSASCEKYSSQIDFVKKDLLAGGNVSNKEIELYKIEVSELLGKDASDLVNNYLHKDFEFNVSQLDTLVSSKKYDIYKDKTYFKVLAYRMSDKDTVAKSIYYLTDKNKIYFREYLK